MRRHEPTTGDRRLEHLRTIAREAGLKLTHQRLEIFRELAGSEEHPDAERSFRACSSTRVPPGVSRVR